MTLSISMRRAGAGLAFIGAALIAVFPARAEVDIVEVTSTKGITAWLVEDQSDPIVTIAFSFEGGTVQDPKGKEGLTALLASLLTEGAGELDADAFQQRLYETGAELSIETYAEDLQGTLRMPADRIAEPLELLSLALTSPRFDQAPLAKTRNVTTAQIEAKSTDPDEQGEMSFAAALFGDHPLGRSATKETVGAVTREDLLAFHKKMLARSNLVIGVAGAIDPLTLRKVLDQVFGDLPEKAELKDIAPPKLSFGKKVFERYDRPQTDIKLVFPGRTMDDGDYYAAALVDHVLGGGMESRLFKELREKNGLTYGAYAALDTHRHWGDLEINTSTKAESTGAVLRAMRNVVHELAENGPTQEELAAAKKYLIGGYAITSLNSTSRIASTLLALQRFDLGMDYPNRLEELFGKVTLNEAKAVAKRLLSVEPAQLVVGPEEG